MGLALVAEQNPKNPAYRQGFSMTGYLDILGITLARFLAKSSFWLFRATPQRQTAFETGSNFFEDKGDKFRRILRLLNNCSYVLFKTLFHLGEIVLR